jgi:hypothetical protein
MEKEPAESFDDENEVQERDSLVWEGGDILKRLKDPPRVFHVLNGVVAVAVLDDNCTIAVHDKDTTQAIAKLAQDVQAMTEIRKRANMTWRTERTFR